MAIAEVSKFPNFNERLANTDENLKTCEVRKGNSGNQMGK